MLNKHITQRRFEKAKKLWRSDTPSSTTMTLLTLPKELRLQIFSELLVDPDPIVFGANWDFSRSPSRPLVRYKEDGLCPAVLQLNRQTHSEASPILYINNCFKFSDDPIPSFTGSADIAPFFSQIGSQTSRIRHICITLPSSHDFFDYQTRVELLEPYAKNLKLIRDTCTGITTFELSVDPHCVDDVLGDSPMAAGSRFARRALQGYPFTKKYHCQHPGG
jgi:hypothetical protein